MGLKTQPHALTNKLNGHLGEKLLVGFVLHSSSHNLHSNGFHDLFKG